jgi:2-polyprenyl-3-methyl-5-hydroxy-6-metoxy-1,4-benzoquinol methylase
MTHREIENPNRWAQNVWNENADFWDTRMGEGNDFVEYLVWPPTQQLLALQPGQQVLDIACGNGLTSRRLAALGARVVAFDFAANMIRHARRRTVRHADAITYHVLDATDEAALLALGEGRFDAALCNMALFDMAEIRPLLSALTRLLRPSAPFVFSVLHPCFNGPDIVQVGEQHERDGEIYTLYSIKVFSYLSTDVKAGLATRGQPRAQPIFHRPLHVLLGACFQAGFVLDGLEESAFPPDHPPHPNPLSWGSNFSEIPPVLIARVRRPIS